VISAIVLAAGRSRRMGAFNQLLPFGECTIVEQIVATLLKCSVNEVVVVTGHRHAEVAQVLRAWPVRRAHNVDYAAGEMLSSVQCGLLATAETAHAALICLGDQPHLARPVVETLVDAWRMNEKGIVLPTYGGRRGHPILLDRRHWAETLALPWTTSLRQVIHGHADDVLEVPVEQPGILTDIDTPEDHRGLLNTTE
jgi:molybdenum cofactor cytidylyltransferase